MKKTILTLAIVLTAGFTMAGGEKYQQIMGETLGKYATCKTVNDYQTLANKFSMIANKETSEWLPLYYHAHCYIMMSFMERNDKDLKDGYLDVAEKSLDKLIEMQPEESEAYALKALYLTARLVVNPMTRGAIYGAKSNKAAEKSLTINALNPRAKYIKLSNDMGTAQFFGQDMSAYCDDAKTLVESWDEFKPESAIHPNWGKNLAKQLTSGCE